MTEDPMTRKLLSVALLALLSAPALIAFGCASNEADQPHALTGNNGNNLAAADKDRYTDQKGHFHSEWVDRDRYHQQ
jgi:hypothetical protein